MTMYRITIYYTYTTQITKHI